MRAGRAARMTMAALVASLVAGGCADTSTADLAVALVNATFNERLATRWAPIHYQDVDPDGPNSESGISDYVQAVDFDGDWDTQNNWEHVPLDPPYEPVAYYSVVETGTHWFIVYAFYHPRDWSDTPGAAAFDQHENDMEGALALIRRPTLDADDQYGEIVAMVTVAHHDLLRYVVAGGPVDAQSQPVDGFLSFGTFDGADHPKTAQEAEGHAMRAWPYAQIEGGDGIRYLPPDGSVDWPRSNNDRFVRYRLVHIFEPGGLWAHRDDPLTFAAPGAFRGDNGADNAANAPWAWRDGDDGIPAGTFATDPARLVDAYFVGLGPFSRDYTFNLYQGIPSPVP